LRSPPESTPGSGSVCGQKNFTVSFRSKNVIVVGMPNPPTRGNQLKTWPRRVWLAFRRWPTLVQVLVWIFYGFLVLPVLWLLSRAFGGPLTPKEWAEQARARSVGLERDRFRDTWGSVSLQWALIGLLLVLVGALLPKGTLCAEDAQASLLPALFFTGALVVTISALAVAVRWRVLAALGVLSFGAAIAGVSGPEGSAAVRIAFLMVGFLLGAGILVWGVFKRAEPRRQRNLALAATLLGYLITFPSVSLLPALC